MNPIVIGGGGGSGTRAAARFFKAIGVQMGEYLTARKILENTHALDYDPDSLPGDSAARATEMIHSAADIHCAPSVRDGRWGFKNPSHIFLLPIPNRAFPEFVFVHVLRDGRDMLFSENRNQLRSCYINLSKPTR